MRVELVQSEYNNINIDHSFGKTSITKQDVSYPAVLQWSYENFSPICVMVRVKNVLLAASSLINHNELSCIFCLNGVRMLI